MTRGLVAATGATASSFRAVRRSLVQKPNKRQLLEEYAAANDLGQLSKTPANLDAAMRYLYNMLLRDLRPPSMMHAFPHALPGNGLLSRYLCPCCLKWDVDQGAGLFGEAVVEQISRAVGVVDLELYGFLARPLYVCTASSGSKEQMLSLIHI